MNMLENTVTAAGNAARKLEHVVEDYWHKPGKFALDAADYFTGYRSYPFIKALITFKNNEYFWGLASAKDPNDPRGYMTSAIVSSTGAVVTTYEIISSIINPSGIKDIVLPMELFVRPATRIYGGYIISLGIKLGQRSLQRRHNRQTGAHEGNKNEGNEKITPS